MSDRSDEKLEALLRSRPLAPPGPDLAARIARAARALPQSRRPSLTEWLSQLLAELDLPQPALALTVLLLLGMLAGWSVQFGSGPADEAPDSHYAQSFLYPDEDLS